MIVILPIFLSLEIIKIDYICFNTFDPRNSLSIKLLVPAKIASKAVKIPSEYDPGFCNSEIFYIIIHFLLIKEKK